MSGTETPADALLKRALLDAAASPDRDSERIDALNARVLMQWQQTQAEVTASARLQGQGRGLGQGQGEVHANGRQSGQELGHEPGRGTRVGVGRGPGQEPARGRFRAASSLLAGWRPHRSVWLTASSLVVAAIVALTLWSSSRHGDASLDELMQPDVLSQMAAGEM
jgi:hypothetical protein